MSFFLLHFIVIGLEKGYWETSSDDGEHIEESPTDTAIENETSNDATNQSEKNTVLSSDLNSANCDAKTNKNKTKAGVLGENAENRIESKNSSASVPTVQTDAYADKTSETVLNTSTTQQVCYSFHFKYIFSFNWKHANYFCFLLCARFVCLTQFFLIDYSLPLFIHLN